MAQYNVTPSIKYEGDLCIVSIEVCGVGQVPVFQSAFIDEELICDQLTMGTRDRLSKLNVRMDAERLMNALDTVYLGMFANYIITTTQELSGADAINLIQLELELSAYLTDTSSPMGWNQDRIAALCNRISIDIADVCDLYYPTGLNRGPAEITLYGISNKLSISTTNAKHIITIDQYPDFLPKFGRLDDRINSIKWI